MSSIQSAGIIREMLENDGTFPGDPQMDEIWSYDGLGNSVNYKLIYGGIGNAEFLSSPYIANPIRLWDRFNGLTAEGEAFMKGEPE